MPAALPDIPPGLVPSHLIDYYGLEIRGADENTLYLRAREALDEAALDELTFVSGLDVRLVDAPTEAPPVDRPPPLPAGRQSPAGAPPAPGPAPLDGLLREADAVGIVDGLLRHAGRAAASDVHVEPFEQTVRVRLRLDGVLHEVGHIPLHRKESVVARVKILASLDVAERRRPQDGRLHFEHDGRRIDVRVSTLPATRGEKVVMRLLDRASAVLDLAGVGLAGSDLEVVERAIEAPHGMVVVTGPTGSGKTTTLYASLTALNREALNVLTAEDPVEYDLPGINQVRVRPDIGFSFAAALRSFLRQDPDVIMVGEVRDHETAEIAVRAALTGHLVLTTLHTNDAATAVTRLVDMGIEPYLAAASLRLVAAQRLVRRVCPACAEEVRVSASDALRLGADAPAKHLAGRGCDACLGTGYRGRAALFELMPVSEELAERIAAGSDAGRIRAIARRAGVRSLREAGVEAMARGITTPVEVLRATT